MYFLSFITFSHYLTFVYNYTIYIPNHVQLTTPHHTTTLINLINLIHYSCFTQPYPPSAPLPANNNNICRTCVTMRFYLLFLSEKYFVFMNKNRIKQF